MRLVLLCLLSLGLFFGVEAMELEGKCREKKHDSAGRYDSFGETAVGQRGNLKKLPVAHNSALLHGQGQRKPELTRNQKKTVRFRKRLQADRNKADCILS